MFTTLKCDTVTSANNSSVKVEIGPNRLAAADLFARANSIAMTSLAVGQSSLITWNLTEIQRRASELNDIR